MTEPPSGVDDADAEPPAVEHPIAEPTVVVPDPPAKLGPLAGLISGPGIEAFDSRLDGWADTMRGNRVADRLFYGLSTVGDHGMVWHAIALARVAGGVDTFVGAVELSSALGIEAAIVNGPIKMLFRRVRPVPATARPLKLRQPRTSSFPSGHASAGLFAATLVAARSRWSWPWYLLGGLIGWSRVHVKIHHPSDGVGGALVGWALGRGASRVLPRVRRALRY